MLSSLLTDPEENWRNCPNTEPSCSIIAFLIIPHTINVRATDQVPVYVVVVVVDCPFGRGRPGDVAYWLWRALKAATSAATTWLRRISSVVGRMLPTAGMRRRTSIIPAQVIRMCLNIEREYQYLVWTVQVINQLVKLVTEQSAGKHIQIWSKWSSCPKWHKTRMLILNTESSCSVDSNCAENCWSEQVSAAAWFRGQQSCKKSCM